MNKGIALSIFYRTVVIFLIVLVLQFLFFNYVFEAYYENRRIEETIEAIEDTTQTLESSAASQMDPLITRFAEEKGFYVSAFGTASEPFFNLDESGRFSLGTSTIVIPPYVSKEVYIDSFHVGSNIDSITLVETRLNDLYFPTSITIGGESFSYDVQKDALNLETIVKFDGVKTSFADRLITDLDKTNERYASLSQLITTYLLEETSAKSFSEDSLQGEYFKSEDRFGAYYVFVSPLIINNEAYTLFTVMPIEPLETIIEDVITFLGVSSLITLLLLAGLTFINARNIAQPLKKLNQSVKRIANLDFAPIENMQGNDEIATLSQNINIMRINLEDSLKKLNAQNSRLKESLKRENSLDRERKDFIASLSHELKTPLTVIEASSEALREGVFDKEEDIAEQLELIQSEIQKSKTLIEGIMDTYKVDRPSYEETFKPLDLYSLIEETLEESLSLFNKEHMTYSLKGDTANIKGDKEKLKLAFSNVFSNAANHSERGGELIIDISSSDVLNVTITNTCATMPVKLIQAFSDETTLEETTAKGSGVGLHIIRLIMNQHNAEAWFESSENEVTFKVIFEAVDKDD
jgi:signal transduction histidine kinase